MFGFGNSRVADEENKHYTLEYYPSGGATVDGDWWPADKLAKAYHRGEAPVDPIGNFQCTAKNDGEAKKKCYAKHGPVFIVEIFEV